MEEKISWCPLWSTIVKSSLWDKPLTVRIVFIAMLATKDSKGFVRGTIGSIKRDANLESEEEAEEAIKVLEGPDKDSASPDFEGRRIQRVPGGWVVLGHAKYRDMMQKVYRNEYQREKQREYRARKPKPLPGETTNQQIERTHGTEAAEAHADRMQSELEENIKHHATEEEQEQGWEKV